jgi:hypothetical protein
MKLSLPITLGLLAVSSAVIAQTPEEVIERAWPLCLAK